MSKRILLIITLFFITITLCNTLYDILYASDLNQKKELQENFKEPPPDCWPHTRWWWPGNPVSKETITWHLEQMRARGITGVEQITMGSYYEKGGIPFMSDEFLDMLKHMVLETERLGMEVSINFGGPGWIIGGNWVPEDERSKDIVPTSVLLKGPARFSGLLPDSLTRTKRSWEIYKPRLTGSEKLLAVVAGKVVDHVIEKESLVILTDKVKRNKLTWQVPSGDWRLMAFWMVRNDHDHAVDHFNTKAMRNYCNYFGGVLYKAFGEHFGKTVESMFIDSFELPNSASGIYWSDDLMDKFKAYKGYDLTAYLPAVWWQVDDISPKIRYDMNEFLHHVGLEVFYKEYLGWCQSHGVKGRIQTYGFTTDNIESAGRAHIPEMEITAGEKDAQDWFDTRIGPKKYVASGAHIYGRKVISVEAYTFIHWERYRATLEELKIASDGFLRAGATKFYNVGYTFSPESNIAPSRALPWAADISPTNIWWDQYPLLAEYIARCSYLLRQGDFAPDIAVYSPVANQWTLNVLNARKWTREFDWGVLGDLLMSNGYDFDLLNDDALQNIARTDKNEIRIRNMAYKVLLLPNIKALPLKTLEFIQGYVREGGVVIALERVPDRSTGFIDYESMDRHVQRIIAEMFKEPRGRDGIGTVNYGSGHTHYIKMVLDRSIWWDKRSSMLDPFLNTIRGYIPPDFGIDFVYEGLRKNAGLSFMHRKLGESDIYFVSNIQDRASTFPVTFRVTGKNVWKWDPYHGKISRIYNYQETDKGTIVPLNLSAYESTFIVFEPGESDHVEKSGFYDIIDIKDDKVIAEAAENGVYHTTIKRDNKKIIKTSMVKDIPAPYEINGSWRLVLEGKDFPGTDTTFSYLFSWTDIPSTRHFSGTGKYEIHFDLPAAYISDNHILRLDLGKIGAIGEVIINGNNLGTIWMRGQQIDITKSVQAGENTLTVLVTNTLINRVSGFTEPRPVPKELVGRFGSRTTPSGMPPEFDFEPLPASGLMGPVRIRVYKTVGISL